MLKQSKFYLSYPLLRMSLTVLLGCLHTLRHVYCTTQPQQCRNRINHEIRKGAKRLMAIAKTTPQLIIEPQVSLQNTQPCIYMSNHCSLLDIPLIYATLPGSIRFITKPSALKWPLYRHAMKAAEILSITEDDLFLKAKKLMQSGVSIWVFPEGQRSREGELQAFKAGAFRLARETGAMIIPVALQGTHQLLPAKTRQLSRGIATSVRIGAPIDATHYYRAEKHGELIKIVYAKIHSLLHHTGYCYEKNLANH